MVRDERVRNASTLNIKKWYLIFQAVSSSAYIFLVLLNIHHLYLWILFLALLVHIIPGLLAYLATNLQMRYTMRRHYGRR